MKNKASLTSNTDEWSTPQDFFDTLNKEFNFTLDPCSTNENHKCSRYYTLEDDGLSKNWGGERVFVNPPYSRISDIVVLLIPSRTDTRYFHDYILYRSEIRFVKGRLKFGEQSNSAPFPSMIVIFRGAKMQENNNFLNQISLFDL